MNEADALILGVDARPAKRTEEAAGGDANFSRIISEQAQRTGVPEWLLRSVIKQESGFNPRAVNQGSGAAGLGQLMPATAQALGVTNRFDPEESIRGSADYLAQGLAASGGNVRRGLMYYYGGPDERQWGQRTQSYPDQVLRHAPEGQEVTGLASSGKDSDVDPVLKAMREAARSQRAGESAPRNAADALILGAPPSWSAAPEAPPKKAPAAAEEPSSFTRGAKVALGQNMPSVYASLGLAGDLGERLFGEGGLSTGVKNFGLAGYAAAQEKLAPLSRENDDVTVAFEKAKGGDLGALIDWGTYTLGQTAGYIGTSAAMALLGGLLGTAAAPGPGTVGGAVAGAVGKGAVQQAAKTLFEKVVEKRAQQMVKGGIAEEVAKRAAVKSVASDIGAAAGVGANSLAQEAGQIYPAAVEEAKQEGRSLDGADMARVVGTTIAAAGIDWLTDLLGLGAITGRIGIPGIGGRVARAATGAAIGSGMEGTTEAAQSVLERLGAGQPLSGSDARRGYINAAAMGAFGGGAVGGAAGALGKARSGDVIRADGQPFPSPADAVKAAEKNKYAGYEPIQVQGGWALRASPLAGAETAATPGEPSPATEAIDQIKREGTVRDATANIERIQQEMAGEAAAAQPLPELFPSAAHEPIEALLERFAPAATPFERQQAAEAVRAAAARSAEAAGRIIPSTDTGLQTMPATEASPTAGVPERIADFGRAEAQREAQKQRELAALQAESQVPRAEFDNLLAERMGQAEADQPTAMAIALRRALKSKAAAEAATATPAATPQPKAPPKGPVGPAGQGPPTKAQGAPAASVGVPLGGLSAPRGNAAVAQVAGQPVVLQNRNRATAASVAQMHAIAANPEPSKLSFSRELATGAPVVFGDGDALPRGAALGREDTIVTASGRPIPIRYAAVEAGSLVPSNTADGVPVGLYRAGAPGVLRVVAGNGRTAGLQRAYEIGREAAYRRGIALDSSLHGVPESAIDAMRRPVLVRVMREADVTPDIGAESNVSGVGTLSAAEMAITDAGRVDLDSLEFDDAGAPTQASVRQFILAMPESERTGLLGPDGAPTRQAVDRLMAATFFAAYEDRGLVELYAQAVDPDARAILSALAGAAGSMVKLRDAGPLDIRPIVAEAAQVAVNAARNGVALRKWQKQGDLMVAADTAQVVEVFVENLRSWRKIAESLRRAAEFAYREANKPAEDLLGPTTRAGRNEILGALNEQRGEKNLAEPAGLGAAAVDAARATPNTGATFSLAEAEVTRKAPDSGGVAQRKGSYAALGDLFDERPVLRKEQALPDQRREQASAGDVLSAATVPGAKFATVVEPTRVGELRTAHERIVTAEQAAHTLAGLRKYPNERFDVLVLDKHFRPLAVLRLFAGAISQAGVYPEVVTKAVYDTPGAAHIWFAHNHPSGDSEPSGADELLTATLATAFGVGTGVRVSGHVVIAGSKAAAMGATGRTVKRFDIKPEPRRYSVKITDRIYKKVGSLGDAISSPTAAKVDVPRIAEGKTGVVFADSQRRPVAFLPLGAEQMRRLRSGGEAPAAKLLFGAAARSNAAAAFLNFSEETAPAVAKQAAENVYAALAETREIRVLDAIHGGKSMTESSGGMTGRGGGYLYGKFLSVSARERAGGMLARKLDELLLPFRERWRGLDIRVVQSTTDVPFNVPATTEGAYVGDGKIWLVADNIPSQARLYEVLAHEAVGHAGMEEVIGKDLLHSAIRAVIGMERAGNSLVRELASIVDDRQPGLPQEARAKEIIALMAERGEPGKMPVWRRVVEAVRKFLRDIGMPFEWVNRQTEADVFRLLRKAEHGLSAIDRPAIARGSDPRLSVRPPAKDGHDLLTRLEDTDSSTPFEHTASLLKSPRLIDALAGIAKATRKNDRSINPLIGAFMTQYGKAEHWAKRGKTRFREVFRETQAFLGDTAMFASAAEAVAPSLLRRLGGLGDWRGGARSADIKAIAAPLYEGTLYGGGNPLSGIRWSPSQLRARFGLTDTQIKLYDEYQAAVGRSLDDFAQSVIYKHATNNGLPFRRGMVLDDAAAEVAGAMRNEADSSAAMATEQRRYLAERSKELAAEAEEQRKIGAVEAAARSDDEARRLKDEYSKNIDALVSKEKALRASAKDVDAIAERVAALKRAGYVPLMRFGRHIVEAYETLPDGSEKKVWRSHHEGAPLVPNSGQAEASRVADALRKKHPDWRVETSLLNKDQWRLYQRINPEALELFAGHLDAESDAAYQEWLRVATTNNSTMRRMIHREGMPGFSLDSRRALAAFILSNARAASANYHMANMLRLAEEASQDGGDIGSEAVKLVEYVRHPEEEAHRLRSFLFFQYLGGSLASAMVNATQVPMMTFPYLAQYEGVARLAARLAAAAKDAVKSPDDIVGDMGEALRRAEADGVTAPQEIHQLAATASGNPLAGQYGVNAFMRLWGAPFAAAEVFNRRTTFIAAYQIGESLSKDQLRAAGVADAFGFAEKAVNETQGIYNKGSRPNVGRGAIGATLMTFRQFSVMWLELLARLPPKQQLLMLGMLALAAGIEGLPFEEDIEDIIDTIGQWAGYATNTRRTLRGWAASAGEGVASLVYSGEEAKKVGETLARLFLRGASAPGWLDVSARLGMHNILPGTSLLRPSASSRDKTRDIAELGGPAASLVTSIGDALSALATGKPTVGAESVAPLAVRNMVRGARTLATGEIRDDRGRLILPDATIAEGAGQIVGFNPQRKAAQSRAMADISADRRLMTTKRAEIVNQWVDGAITGNDAKMAAARDALRDWNTTNPDLRIVIRDDALRRSIAEAKITQRQRFIKALPKTMRRGAEEDVPAE